MLQERLAQNENMGAAINVAPEATVVLIAHPQLKSRNLSNPSVLDADNVATRKPHAPKINWLITVTGTQDP